MNDVSKWGHKDEWHQYGKDFLVVVKRYAVEPASFDSYQGPNRWGVYAYIYPKHQLFSGFCGPSMWQPAANALPLHGGPSLLRWHYSDDHKPTSVQIGADYNHLHDERFSKYTTADDAYEVFADAQQLFGYLTKA